MDDLEGKTRIDVISHLAVGFVLLAAGLGLGLLAPDGPLMAASAVLSAAGVIKLACL